MTEHSIPYEPHFTPKATEGIVRARTIAYLGSPTDHLNNFRSLLASVRRELLTIPDSIATRRTGRRRFRYIGALSAGACRASRVLDQLFGTSDREYTSHLCRAIDKGNIECVIAFWGIQPLCDVIALKRARPHVKVILNVLCHPLALSPFRVAIQNWLLRRSLEWLDGLIISSEAMAGYLRSHVPEVVQTPAFIWPPYLSVDFFPRRRLSPCKQKPNMVFLGRMDWRHGQAADNMTAYLNELMDNGVHIYCHGDDKASNRQYEHKFGYMKLSDATEYATQFDASLAAYNLSAIRSPERFSVTVPDRLVASVAAGIPIAIPANGYQACKEYLKAYRAVIEFKSASTLADALLDRPRMEALRTMGEQDSRHYVGERHISQLLAFAESLWRH